MKKEFDLLLDNLTAAVGEDKIKVESDTDIPYAKITFGNTANTIVGNALVEQSMNINIAIITGLEDWDKNLIMTEDIIAALANYDTASLPIINETVVERTDTTLTSNVSFTLHTRLPLKGA